MRAGVNLRAVRGRRSNLMHIKRRGRRDVARLCTRQAGRHRHNDAVVVVVAMAMKKRRRR